MAKVYVETVIEPIVQPLTDTLCKPEEWTFQQDSAPAHKSKLMQEWLKKNVHNFIRQTDWLLGGLNLDSLDYDLWNYLEQDACSKHHSNLETLKQSI